MVQSYDEFASEAFNVGVYMRTHIIPYGSLLYL